MEYAIAGGVTALFILLYLVTRPKEREKFVSALNEEEFAARAKRCAETLAAPTDGGDAPKTAPFKKQILRAISRSEHAHGDGELTRLFMLLAERKEDLKKLAKEDFSALQDMPQSDGTPRGVTAAALTLECSRFIFCAERAETVLTAFNAARTLTFSETENMRLAFKYVLFRKLAFLCERLMLTEKIRRTALRVAAHPVLYKLLPRVRRTKSVIFARFCAGEMGYDIAVFEKRYLAVTDGLAEMLGNVIDSLDNVEIFDFSAYYEPCGILSRYDAYLSASPEARSELCKKLGELSDAENLDEYAYAVRLENFGDYGRLPPLNVKRLAVGKGSLIAAYVKGDLLMPARAISSGVMMQMLFGEGNGDKKSKSIIKNVKIKSSYLPKTGTPSLNFGIVVRGDKVFLSDTPPREIPSVQCTLLHSGTEHTVRIVRGGDEPTVTVNGTLMKGVPAVTLGDSPLDIIFTLPQNDAGAE